MAAASVSYHDISLDSASSRRVHLNSSSPNQQHLQADLHDMNRVHPLPSGSPDGAGDCKEGAYHIPRPSECLMSWDEICQFIATGDLDDLKRHPLCESEYASWAAPIRAKWGSLESYIRSRRLGWGAQSSMKSHQGSRSDTDERIAGEEGGIRGESSAAPLCFNADMDQTMAKCIPNDWPYAVPGDCAHYVVWCRVPIIDSSLFSTSPPTSTSTIPFPTGSSLTDLFASVTNDGVRGLTGQTPSKGSKPKQVIGLGTVTSILTSKLSIPKDSTSSSDSPNARPLDLDWDEEAAAELAALAHKHAGRLIHEYVIRNWNEEEWQTAWFCNPPHLRTVPGLSHFHVVARRKTSQVDLEK